MFKVLVSDPLAEEGIEILRREGSVKVDIKTKLPSLQLKEIIKNYDALIVRSGTRVTKDIIESAKRLKVIGRAGVGLDNLDVEAASRRGIVVLNTPGGNTISTAEHTISMLLSLSRNIPQADRSVKEGQWDRKRFMGVELYGKLLGIIGLGRIGSEVAKRALSFQMKVIAYDPFLSVEKASQLGVELSDLNHLLRCADYITIHTPLTADTRHLISDEQFKLMKQGVRIVNCARGGIIDESALIKALKSGKVAGCALDVFEKEPLPPDSELLKLPNVILTPHLGASTEEAQINVAVDVAESVLDVLLNRCVRNAVNMPCLDAELLKNLRPFVDLAEKLGSLGTQLVEGHVKNVRIRYIGEITEYDTSSLTIAILKGVLSPMMQETVNYVNAPVVARSRGISFSELRSSQIENFANLICVEITTNITSLLIEGTLFTKIDPRVVRINGYYVDAVPSGYMLFISNKDVPGIIGQIGTILGENKINIAGMSFGRQKKGGRAISVLNVDSIVPKDILQKIKSAKNIYDAKLIKL